MTPFTAILLPHVLAGLTAVISGALAATARKRPGRHPTAGTVYYWSITAIFATATAMSALRWHRDAYLFVFGTVAFSFATLGYLARKRRWEHWQVPHITGMGLSYITLLTAFYVDNGPNLPVWKHLPHVTYWVLPAAVGLPIVARALARHAPRRRSTVHVLGKEH